MSATKRLDELLAVEEAAKARAAELAGNARARSRELTAARFDLEALDRAAGRGEKVDPAKAEKLTAMLGEPGVERGEVGGVLVDARAEARAAGAAEVVEEAATAVGVHAAANLGELLGDAARDADEARDELLAAAEALEAAEAKWRSVSAAGHRLVRLAAGDREVAAVLASAESAGWRLPGVPIGLDAQALADLRVVRARDPRALLPVSHGEPGEEVRAA